MLARRRFLAGLALAGACFGQPLLRVADRELPASPVVIAYGDMRFNLPETINLNR